MFGALDNNKEKESASSAQEKNAESVSADNSVEQSAKQNEEFAPAAENVKDTLNESKKISPEDNTENASLEPAGAEVEPEVTSEVANTGVEVKHEKKDEANLQETAAALSSEAIVQEPTPSLAKEKPGEIFPSVLSTGELAKGNGVALNTVEERRFRILKFAKIPKIKLPKIMGGSKVSDGNKPETVTVNK